MLYLNATENFTFSIWRGLNMTQFSHQLPITYTQEIVYKLPEVQTPYEYQYLTFVKLRYIWLISHISVMGKPQNSSTHPAYTIVWVFYFCIACCWSEIKSKLTCMNSIWNACAQSGTNQCAGQVKKNALFIITSMASAVVPYYMLYSTSRRT